MNADALAPYHHSGKFSVAGLLLPLALTAVAAFPLGLAYAFVVRWIPFIYLNALVCIGYGMAIGWIATRAVKIGLVRSPGLAAAGGAGAGVIALYAIWSGAIHHLFQGAPWVAQPDLVWRAMHYLYLHSSWTISSHGGDDGMRISGLMLAVVWVVEAAIIVGFATWLPYQFVAHTPFSEEGRCWLDQKKNIDTLDYFTDAREMAALKEGDIGPVVQARARPANSPMFARLTLKRARRPAGFCTLRVQNVTRKVDRKKKVTEKVVPLTRDLVLMDSMYDVIAQLEQIRPEAGSVVPERPGELAGPAPRPDLPHG